MEKPCQTAMEMPLPPMSWRCCFPSADHVAMGARNMRPLQLQVCSGFRMGPLPNVYIQNIKLATVNLLNPQESEVLPVPLRFRDIKTAGFSQGESFKAVARRDSQRSKAAKKILHGFSSNVQKFGKSLKV